MMNKALEKFGLSIFPLAYRLNLAMNEWMNQILYRALITVKYTIEFGVSKNAMTWWWVAFSTLHRYHLDPDYNAVVHVYAVRLLSW